ncbi:MAG: ZIP family metal transporter [Nanohaloarchaea archaeon]|nr:ZIP family metal transporter [Candidatus Nanohaloarchaea archaeon]
MVYKNILLSIGITAVLSALGALFLFVEKERMERYIPYMISLSAGTIFGGVFIHLVFKLAGSYTRFTGLAIMAGILGSFLLEKLVHWHCHHADHHYEPFSIVLVVGDAIHNILDGILIASSFLASTSAGVAATIAVALHKVPKEIGDFGILVHSGFTRVKAFGFNLGISVFMFLGALAVIMLSNVSGSIQSILLPLVVGNFVYIAGSDLMPEIKDIEDNWAPHVLVFSIGVAIMYSIPYIKALI